MARGSFNLKTVIFAEVLEGDFKVSSPKILMRQMPFARTYSVLKRPWIYECNVISFITYEKQGTESSTLATSRGKNIKINPFLCQVTIIFWRLPTNRLFKPCKVSVGGPPLPLLWNLQEVVVWSKWNSLGLVTVIRYIRGLSHIFGIQKSLLTARGKCRNKNK